MDDQFFNKRFGFIVSLLAAYADQIEAAAAVADKIYGAGLQQINELLGPFLEKIDAAAALACQLWIACPGSGGGDCVLPAGVTKVTRQGIEIDRGVLANWFNPTQGTGLPAVDLFLKSYWAERAPRQSLVWSPDVPGYPRRVGQ